MRPPLWILNSVLFLFLLATVVFILLSRPAAPVWEDLAVGTIQPLQKKVSEINISKIYDYDLFDTYQRVEQPTQEPDYVVPLPATPTPNPVVIPEEPKPQFLDPLKISLKGLIIIAHDDTKNRAIIADTTTKNETVYKVGDTIEDAQLIKIVNNKAIFLRSNGQQEVLYLRQKDAQQDPSYVIIEGWKGVAQKTAEDSYNINTLEFTQRVTSLAQFIDLLEITTVYKQGVSVGCRIGKIAQDSLGTELGLQRDDIILSIDGISAADSKNRLAIYKKIAALQTKNTITVQLLRNKTEMTLHYTLTEKITEQELTPSSSAKVNPPVAQPTQEQLHQLQERHKFAPTLHDIRAQEHENMVKKGKLPRKKSLSSTFAQ